MHVIKAYGYMINRRKFVPGCWSVGQGYVKCEWMHVIESLHKDTRRRVFFFFFTSHV